MFMSLFGRKKLCNLLCQPDKLLGCLAAPEYRAACAYILQRSLSLRCVPLSSPLPSPLPQSWRVHRVPTSAGHSDPIPAGIASQLSGSLRPTLAGHCDLRYLSGLLRPIFSGSLRSTFSRSLRLNSSRHQARSICLPQKGVDMMINVANPNQFKLYSEIYILLY